MSLGAYLLHHSESLDPTLWDWIRHEIDAVVGLNPETIVAILGVLIVAFPVALFWMARRQIRSASSGEVTGGSGRARRRLMRG